MAVTIDSGLSTSGGIANPVYQITTAPERTRQQVVDIYASQVNLLQQVANAPASAITDTVATGVVNAMNTLRSLALNGLTVPNALDPNGPPEQAYVTTDMANQIDMLSRSLRAAGIVDGVANAAAILRWQDLKAMGLDTIITDAVNAAGRNSSFQAMIELEYVKAGNDVLEQQLTNLQTALQATKATTDLLGQLQTIHNLISPGTTDSNAMLLFSDPRKLEQINQNKIFAILTDEEKAILGITNPSQITKDMYYLDPVSAAATALTVPLGGAPPSEYLQAANLHLGTQPKNYGIIGNILWRLWDPDWGDNALTAQQIAAAGISAEPNFTYPNEIDRVWNALDASTKTLLGISDPKSKTAAEWENMWETGKWTSSGAQVIPGDNLRHYIFANKPTIRTELGLVGTPPNVLGFTALATLPLNDSVAPSAAGIATQNAIYNLLTPDQRNAIWQHYAQVGTTPVDVDNETQAPASLRFTASEFTAALITQARIFNTGDSTIKAPNAGKSIMTMLRDRLNLTDPSDPKHLTVQQLNDLGLYTQPNFELLSERQRLYDILTPEQRAQWGITNRDNPSINPSAASIIDHTNDGIIVTRVEDASYDHYFSGANGDLKFAYAPTGTMGQTWANWFNSPVSDGHIRDEADSSDNFNSLDSVGKAQARGILRVLSADQLLQLGLPGTQGISQSTILPYDPIYSGFVLLNPQIPDGGLNSGDLFNSISANIFGKAIDPVVDFKGQDENSVLNRLQSIRRQLAEQLAVLDQLNPPGAGGRDPNSLAGQIAKVLQDLQNNMGDPDTTNPQDAITGMRRWILDNVDRHASDPDPANQAAAKTSGDIQRNLQAAITGATNLNDSQNEDFRRYTFIFDEFYKSASSMLSRITQILEKIAQNAGR